MTNFKGNYVTKDDVKIAKNYLSENELQRLNLLVSGFLDFAEFQALEMNPMTMKDWIDALELCAPKVTLEHKVFLSPATLCSKPHFQAQTSSPATTYNT